MKNVNALLPAQNCKLKTVVLNVLKYCVFYHLGFIRTTECICANSVPISIFKAQQLGLKYAGQAQHLLRANTTPLVSSSV